MIQGDSVLGLFLARDALPYFKCKIQFPLMNKKNMICTSTKKLIPTLDTYFSDTISNYKSLPTATVIVYRKQIFKVGF